MIWALGVGYVISGMYFGWNLGLPLGGTYGMLAATLLVSVLYVAFVFSYAELASAMPSAGGAFVYATRSLGGTLGAVAGIAQWIEFVFAPPAIAAAIGAYFRIFFPRVPEAVFAIGAYAIFTAINVWGVALSAGIELLFTVCAVVELMVFFAVTSPKFTWAAFARDALPHGWGGAFDAIPFAVWFYLGIEGIANIAEEAKRPERDLPRGFLAAMATLLALAFGVLFCASGIAGWDAIVNVPGFAEPSDKPLPLALGRIVGESHPLYHMLVTIGLFGLVASFHGLVLAAGRVTMEIGRVGFAPAAIGRVHPRRKTPVAALLVNLACGIAALLTGKTGDIITLSVMGALSLYLLVAVSQLVWRHKEPHAARVFRTPGHPITSIVAAALSLLCLAAVVRANLGLAAVYLGLLGAGLLWYRFGVTPAAKERAGRAS